MRIVIRSIGVLVLSAVAFFLAMLAASELGGEVVTLRTGSSERPTYETSLWVVDDGGHMWLRGGAPESGWVKRLTANPEVELERNGTSRRYRAQLVPGRRDRINQLMAEKYGWADRLIGVMRSNDGVTVIRLIEEPQ